MDARKSSPELAEASRQSGASARTGGIHRRIGCARGQKCAGGSINWAPPPFSTGCTRRAPRSGAAPIPASCQRRARTRRKSRACVGHISATASALTRFLAWFAREAPKGQPERNRRGARCWKRFRRGTGALKDLSFDSISGAGPNGAIVHYRVTKSTNRQIDNGRHVPDRFRRAISPTAPPTSPAPGRRARRPRKCATVSPAC